jgi:seryl-tRNA synthetase
LNTELANLKEKSSREYEALNEKYKQKSKEVSQKETDKSDTSETANAILRQEIVKLEASVEEKERQIDALKAENYTLKRKVESLEEELARASSARNELLAKQFEPKPVPFQMPELKYPLPVPEPIPLGQQVVHKEASPKTRSPKKSVYVGMKVCYLLRNFARVMALI